MFSAFFSCKKTEDHKNHQTVLNLDFPAAFVANGSSNDISVINLNTNKEHSKISLNGATFPHHIYISPDKSKLAVAITSSDLSAGHGDHAGHGASVLGLKVQILNTKTGAIEKEIALNKMPHNAIFSPNGTELWLGQFDTTQSNVLVYNTSDWSLKNTIAVGKGLSEVTFSKSGTMVFATNTKDGTVSMIDATNKTVQKTIEVGLDPVGAWPGTDGNMYVDNEKSRTISVIEISSGTVINTIPLGYKPGYAAQHSNGELWVSDATNGKVLVYELASGTWVEKQKLVTGADAHAITFSLDGSKAYVSNQGAGNVSVINTSNYSKVVDIVVGAKPNGIALKQ
jgi:YVTN family beta-propeller protein